MNNFWQTYQTSHWFLSIIERKKKSKAGERVEIKHDLKIATFLDRFLMFPACTSERSCSETSVSPLLPCQWGATAGLTMIGAVPQESWAEHRLSLDRKEKQQRWRPCVCVCVTGGVGGWCLLLSVCVLWTFAPRCYIYVPADSVSPSLTCEADLCWSADSCLELLLQQRRPTAIKSSFTISKCQSNPIVIKGSASKVASSKAQPDMTKGEKLHVENKRYVVKRNKYR